jgi:hypothetical protein
MDTALKIFLDGLIDYAGLFPPAALDLSRAMTEYVRHRDGPDAWMLGRFVVSCSRLPEARTQGIDYPSKDGRPWRFSALVGGGETESDVLGRLRSEGDILTALRGRGGVPRPFVVEALESRLPGDVLSSNKPERVRSFVVRALETLEDAVPSTIELYVEGPPGEGDATIDRAIIDGLAGVGGSAKVGVKLRCGGQDETSFPPVSRVAGILSQCKASGVPIKFTGGLHWPIRRTLGGQSYHGFVNVLGAAVLVHAGVIDGPDVAACVGETEASAFSFSDGVFSWRGRRVSAAAVAKARKSMVAGFGSAFFDDPRKGLKALGWWPQDAEG